MTFKKTLFLLLMVYVSGSFAQGDDYIDSIIKVKVVEYQIKKLTINTIQNELTTLEQIKEFDSHGNLIDNLSNRGVYYKRFEYNYDSLDRKIQFSEYDNNDTSKIHSVVKYVYIDTNTYYIEYSSPNNPVYKKKTYTYKSTKDTIWVTQIEKDFEYNKEVKTGSRYISYGDTLLISEFIKFDTKGKMDQITAYYTLNKRTGNGNLVKTAGQCTMPMNAQIDISLENYYENKEKYLQELLNGNCKYEYGEEVHSYKVYNPLGQLIQVGNQNPNKKTFTYNEAQQLIKITRWGRIHFNDNIVELTTKVYEYKPNGLPLKMVSTTIQTGKVKTYIYTYE
jgi:YD repeat-containing protein